jgi:aspartyl-tRNA(Asn)/glutamyl-tRNA(Gln) amidotransferase subunit A
MNDWHRSSITELHGAFSRGDTTPSEVLRHYLARIEAYDPLLKTFVEIDRDGATSAAKISDARFKADTRRPLEGISIGIKANIGVKGLSLNAGMRAREGMTASEDADVVLRLRNAGAIVIGTLNMHEAALGATTDNPWFGRCINPHGEGRTPGGSSGGSAAAVAAGLCVAALGTDTLGSIRIPAAYTGVYGLKPTPGLVSARGVVPLSDRFDVIGPIARSMDDLSMLTNVLFTPDLATAMRRSRYYQLADLGGVDCAPDCNNALAAVVAELHDLAGLIVLPDVCSRIRTGAFVIATRDLASNLVALGEERCRLFSDELTALLDFAISRSEEDLAADKALVDETARVMRQEIGSNGILILPTAPQTAFAQGDRAPNNQADFACLANIAGLPAISLPVGCDKNGMPVGIQLIGPPSGEAMLIAQARMINDKIRGFVPPPKYW